MTDLERTLARNVRALRAWHGWNQSTMAHKMHDSGHATWTHNVVSAIEVEPPMRRIRLDEAVTMAHLFGVPIQALLTPLMEWLTASPIPDPALD